MGVIDRVSSDDLSVEAFISRYEKPNCPVVITDIPREWKAVAEGAWSPGALYTKYRHRRFKCGEDDRGYPVKIKLKYFVRYMVRRAYE